MTTLQLQICDDTRNYTMGTVDFDADPRTVKVRDVIAAAVEAESAYALRYGFSPGERYELRLWDGEDCVWSTYARGTRDWKLTPNRTRKELS